MKCTFAELLSAYENAIASEQKEFALKDQMFYVPYVKYLIEFLNNKETKANDLLCFKEQPTV